MNKGEILGLADRVEAGDPELQGALLEQAWEAVAKVSAAFRTFACGPCSGFGTNAGKFAAALEARAFESAAMTLVPDGWEYTLMSANGYDEATLTNHSIKRTAWSSGNSLPSAITAAALRAIASTMEDDRG